MNHLKNCETALRYWATVPDKNVTPGLASFQEFPRGGAEKHTCNTVACFGGWVSAMPEFIAMGVTMGDGGAPSIGQKWGWEVAEELFGEGAEDMFDTRSDSSSDGPATEPFTDHELVTYRIKCQITRLKALK